MPDGAIGGDLPPLDPPGGRLRGFLLIFQAFLPIFCAYVLILGEMLLFMGGIRGDIALLAMRPLLFAGCSVLALLIFFAVYLLVCVWLYTRWRQSLRRWRQFLRSEGALAQLADPAPEFLWPGPPQPAGPAMLLCALLVQIFICADQALWAVSAAHHAGALPSGAIKSFWIGIEALRIGVAVAAFGAVVASAFYIRRLRDKVLFRRILAVAVSLLVLSGIGIAAVGVKLQVGNPVPKSVHMEVLHPHAKHK